MEVREPVGKDQGLADASNDSYKLRQRGSEEAPADEVDQDTQA